MTNVIVFSFKLFFREIHLYIFHHAGRDVEGAGFCRLVNTSSSNCWDGMSVIDDDIDMFDGQTVNEQGSYTTDNAS